LINNNPFKRVTRMMGYVFKPFSDGFKDHGIRNQHKTLIKGLISFIWPQGISLRFGSHYELTKS